MKRLLAVIVLALSCGGNTQQAPADARQNLKADWQRNVICYREQDWCACCNIPSINGNECAWGRISTISFVPCKVPEKMGLKIY